MNVSLNGFNESMLTFSANEEIKVGAPVKITNNNTVSACEDGDAPVGFLINQNGCVAGVMMTGYFEKTYSGEDITVGYAEICADQNGDVKMGDGVKVIVTKVDTQNKTVGFIM